MEISIIDEHHEALLVWEKALKVGKIRRYSTLIHVDFHADMGAPQLRRSVYSRDIRRLVEDDLCISDFIIPAILRGIFDEVVFVRPTGKPVGRRYHFAGTLDGNGLISNGSIKRPMLRSYPDARKYAFTQKTGARGIRCDDGVLDIDMDFFCCNICPQMPFSIDLTPSQAGDLARFLRSEDKFSISTGLINVEDKKLSWRPRRSDINVIYNDSEEWIEYSIKSFVRDIGFKPRLVSICRSVKSGFTPKKYADRIETLLIKCLTNPPLLVKTPEISNVRILPFVSHSNGTIFNAYTGQLIELTDISNTIWKGIAAGKELETIARTCKREYSADYKEIWKAMTYLLIRLKKLFIVELS